MTVRNVKIFDDCSRGASMLEVLLAMAIIAVAAPLVYNQIVQTNHSIHELAISRDITQMRDLVLNYVRINQDAWPDVAQIKLSDDELAEISDAVSVAFIDKYAVHGASITDVYLGFELDMDDIAISRVARNIGQAAAVVGADGIAYGDGWAVSAPDFKPGFLIYRVAYDFSGEDKSKYLHRGTSGEDGLNQMQRDLNMGGYNVLDAGTLVAESARARDGATTFVEAGLVSAQATYFSDGANMDGGAVSIGSLRVTGDITGFRNINARDLNGSGYTTAGRIIADRATVSNSINVARDLIIKSDSARTIGAFTGITANSVSVPFVSADEIIFFENFGLTISGELLMSTTPPLKLGAWTFPSATPPRFAEFNLRRAQTPAAPSRDEFGPLMMQGWKSITGVK